LESPLTNVSHALRKVTVIGGFESFETGMAVPARPQAEFFNQCTHHTVAGLLQWH